MQGALFRHRLNVIPTPHSHLSLLPDRLKDGGWAGDVAHGLRICLTMFRLQVQPSTLKNKIFCQEEEIC